jgi:hypothetical protein
MCQKTHVGSRGKEPGFAGCSREAALEAALTAPSHKRLGALDLTRARRNCSLGCTNNRLSKKASQETAAGCVLLETVATTVN